MKTTIFRSSWLVIVFAGALMAPAVLSAQRSDTTRTHVVKAGDTFWSLAVTYLGDGNRWSEIQRLNPSIRATNALPVGTTLRIPGSAPARPQAAPTTPQRAATDTPPPAAPPAPAPDTSRRTIFYGVRPAGGFTPPESVQRVSTAPAVPARVFEAMSAPFVLDSAALERGGRCVSVGQVGSGEARGVVIQGSLTVRLPDGAAPDAGSRWLLVRRGPVLAGLGAVAIPTGVIRLTSAAPFGADAPAEIVAQFDAMSCSDVVLPVPSTPTVPSGRLTTVTDGAEGRVAWIAGESLLPTLQFALILDIGASKGIRVGDRVSIYAGDGSAAVASADVVRVDARSATALIVRQSLGSLAPGLPVRVTEKLP